MYDGNNSSSLYKTNTTYSYSCNVFLVSKYCMRMDVCKFWTIYAANFRLASGCCYPKQCNYNSKATYNFFTSELLVALITWV